MSLASCKAEYAACETALLLIPADWMHKTRLSEDREPTQAWHNFSASLRNAETVPFSGLGYLPERAVGDQDPGLQMPERSRLAIGSRRFDYPGSGLWPAVALPSQLNPSRFRPPPLPNP